MGVLESETGVGGAAEGVLKTDGEVRVDGRLADANCQQRRLLDPQLSRSLANCQAEHRLHERRAVQDREVAILSSYHIMPAERGMARSAMRLRPGSSRRHGLAPWQAGSAVLRRFRFRRTNSEPGRRPNQSAFEAGTWELHDQAASLAGFVRDDHIRRLPSFQLFAIGPR